MPIPLHFVSGVRALEAEMFRLLPSREVMRRAGVFAAERAFARLRGKQNPKVLAVAGPGNNGGDAMVAAAKLREWGIPCAVVFGGDPQRLSDDARWALSEWTQNGGGEILSEFPAIGPRSFALGLDGVFGVGLDRPIVGKYADWIRRVNDSGFPWLAIDAPSGLDANTGAARPPTTQAAETVTFLAEKPGLRTGDGPAFCGEIVFADLLSPPASEPKSEWGRVEIPAGWDANLPEPGGVLVDAAPDLRRLFPSRSAHKGARGTLALAGGARGMEGALALAARAAAGLGTGKVFAVSLSPGAIPFDPPAPEVMWRDEIPEDATAVGIGPGLGKSEAARALLGKVLGSGPPLVLDADALNLIAEDSALAAALRARDGGAILTPHPAEAGRLLGAKTAEVQTNRIAAARELSGRFRADVILKGAGSVLAFAPRGADASGRAAEWAVNGSGNAGLARAGAGDVLTGFVSAFLAQTNDSRFSLTAGAWLHGAAADALWRKQGGPFGWGLGELTAAAGRILNRAE